MKKIMLKYKYVIDINLKTFADMMQLLDLNKVTCSKQSLARNAALTWSVCRRTTQRLAATPTALQAILDSACGQPPTQTVCQSCMLAQQLQKPIIELAQSNKCEAEEIT
jgi:hypothetical protein